MIAATILPYLAVFIAGLIVGRIGAYASGVKHGIEETTKVYFFQKQAIWHDVKQTTPGTDGEIVLLDSESKKFAVGDYSHKSNSIRFADYIEPYTWDDSADTFIYDKWCYVNDLIEK